MRKIITMKKSIILGVIMMATLVGTAQATLITYNSGTLNAAIPDGNLVGITESTTISGIPQSGDYTSMIQNVDVNLNISGGYNGDLYGYLVLQNISGTTTAILLNRIGTSGGDPWGNDGSGIDVTLSSSGALGNIHNAPDRHRIKCFRTDRKWTLGDALGSII